MAVPFNNSCRGWREPLPGLVTEWEQIVATFHAGAEVTGFAMESSADSVLARRLIQELRTAALATLGPDGGPFASHVDTAPAGDGSPLLLLSDLAVHSRNLARDPRSSLLLVCPPDAGSAGNAAVRLTLTGQIFRHDNPEFRSRFLAACPDAERYAAFADFAIYRFSIEAGHLVAGFGRIRTIEGADLLATTGT